MTITGKAREQIPNVTGNSYKSIYHQPIQSRRLSDLPNKLSLHIILIHVTNLNIIYANEFFKIIFCFMAILNKMNKKTLFKKVTFMREFHDMKKQANMLRWDSVKMRGPGTQSYEMGRNPSLEHTELSQYDWYPERKWRRNQQTNRQESDQSGLKPIMKGKDHR